MRTYIEKKFPKPWNEVINSDGMVWETRDPEGEKPNKYLAVIPDKRIDHFSFSGFGYHKVWADTIAELVNDIRALNVPYYSEEAFIEKLILKDEKDTRNDRQVELHFDGRGTKITRGTYNINNMTSYTSL